jgi:hypothetical protein
MLPGRSPIRVAGQFKQLQQRPGRPSRNITTGKTAAHMPEIPDKPPADEEAEIGSPNYVDKPLPEGMTPDMLKEMIEAADKWDRTTEGWYGDLAVSLYQIVRAHLLK